jgi:phospholipid/cholesterol/gamma-HCH transport system substrate-binding protein
MNRQLSETLIGALVLAIAVYFFVTAYTKSGASLPKNGYHISADFGDATGVVVGSDVRISGVKIGSVQSLVLDPESYKARITMHIHEGIQLPEDSGAAIVGESLLGGKFVAVTVGGAEKLLTSGDKIAFTQSSISLEQLLGKFVFSGGGVDSEEDGATKVSAPEDDIQLTVP